MPPAARATAWIGKSKDMPSLSTCFVQVQSQCRLPPIISIGGTSFDKYLATLEAPPNDLPPGVYQYVTTTPQHLLPHSVAGAASRKKIESMVALACISQGPPIDNIPIMMLNMKDRAVAEFVELEILRYVLETHKELQPATVDRSDVITYMEEFSTSIGKRSRGARLVVLDDENPEEVKETVGSRARIVPRTRHDPQPNPCGRLRDRIPRC